MDAVTEVVNTYFVLNDDTMNNWMAISLLTGYRHQHNCRVEDVEFSDDTKYCLHFFVCIPLDIKVISVPPPNINNPKINHR